MKYKKLMLVAFVLLAILTIGAVSASDDVALDDNLTVSDEGSVELSQDADLISEDDDEEDFQLNVEEFVDISDDNSTVASLFCPEGAEGKLIAQVDDGDEFRSVADDYIITEDDYNKTIVWRVGDFEISEPGEYNFKLFLLGVEDELDEDTEPLGDFAFLAYDSTQFSILSEYYFSDINSLLENPTVFTLYCPDGHAGEVVNVIVTYPNKEKKTFTKVISEDDAVLYWTTDELDMDIHGTYEIAVDVNDGEFEDGLEMELYGPIQIGEEAYINSIFDRNSNLLCVEIPTEINKGRITVKLEGNVLLNKTLDEFGFVEETDEGYFWFHPSYGPIPPDESKIHYIVTTDVIEDAEDGEYEIDVTLELEDYYVSESSVNTKVNLVSTNSVTENGVSIEFSNPGEVELEDDFDAIACLLVPEGANGTVLVTSGDIVLCNKSITEFECEAQRYYYILVGDLEDLEIGDEGITVAYLEDGEVLASHTADVAQAVGDDDDDDDAEDGIVISVREDEAFDLENDLDEIFATVSVSDELNGTIAIYIYDEEEEDGVEFFYANLTEIDTADESEIEGFTDYYIALSDLFNFDEFTDAAFFTVAFLDDEGYVMDSRMYTSDVEDGAIYFYLLDDEDEYDDDDVDDGVVILVFEGDETEFDLEEDLDETFAVVAVSDEFDGGNITVYAYDDADMVIEFYNVELSEIEISEESDIEGFTDYYIALSDLDDLERFINEIQYFTVAFIDEEGEEVDYRDYEMEIDDGVMRFWLVGESDIDDGVIIRVIDGDETEFNLEEDLYETFAVVSVSEEFDAGNITIYVYDYENEELIAFFNKELSEIESDESGFVGFTDYYISLSDLDDLEAFADAEVFTIAFFDEEGDEVDSRMYRVEIEDGVMRFWEIDEEDFHGEEISVEFRSANMVTNDPIILIPKENLPDVELDDLFIVTVYVGDEEEYETELSLDELLDDDDYFIISVRELELPEEIGESMDVYITVQFYVDDEEAYYAEPQEDDDDICIYTSPYIRDDAFLLSDDWVVSFRPFAISDDMFSVTVTKLDDDGFFLDDPYVKSFLLSDFFLEDDDEALGEITLSDLNITEVGNYSIAVSFTINGTEFAYRENNVAVDLMDIRDFEPDAEDDEEPAFNDVSDYLFAIRVAEDIGGYVKIYVGDKQVGGNINMSSLGYSTVPPQDGRIIQVNDLGLSESGSYTVKVEIYDKDGKLLGEKETDVDVNVGENSVEFFDIAYGCVVDEAIQFHIGSPLSDGAYFNIYLNGKKAGKYSIKGGYEMEDEFVTSLFDVEILNPGIYNVGVTFFDGVNETDFAAGTFVVASLNMTSANETYIEGEKAIITFQIPDPSTTFGQLRAYYLYSAGPIGFDEDMIFNTLSGDELMEFWENGTFTLELRDLEVGFHLIHVTYDVAANEEDYHNWENVLSLGDIIAFDVIKTPSLLGVDDVEVDYGSTANVTANVTGAVGVIARIGDMLLEVDNLTIMIPALEAGSYQVKVTTIADLDHSSVTKNITVSVKQLETSLSSAGVSTTYGTSKYLTATLRDSTGALMANHDVTIVLNGKSYNGKTNANGQYSIAIPKTLAVKTYTATISFAGDNNHVLSTATAKVVVKKATPKLTAKAKSFKRTVKTKKYTIVLKTDKKAPLKKVKVTIKVGKKTYSAKTNSKGKATFKITKLTKKGKYTAVVKFKGNSKYKAVSKKVKIRVK